MSKQWRKFFDPSSTDFRNKMSIAKGGKLFEPDRCAARDSYLPPLGNIQYPVVNFRGRLRGVPFTRSVYATCVSRRIRRSFPRKELSASRKDCYELTKELRRDIQFARIPTVSFPSAPRAQFSAFTLWLSFYAVFPYEKRSAVSFPPDVAPSKDTGEHWTLLHEIYSYTYMYVPRVLSSSSYRYSIVTPLKALLAVKACSKEREITRTVKKAKASRGTSLIFLSAIRLS